MSWINTLAECFKHTNVSDIAVEKLHARFSGYDLETLDRAVDMYLEEGLYFPTIAQFKPCAENAMQMSATKTIRRVHRHTDEEMYQWELERGTMRPLPEIETEKKLYGDFIEDNFTDEAATTRLEFGKDKNTEWIECLLEDYPGGR